MKNEFNQPLKSYQGGKEYEETICFDENTTDLYVTDECFDFDESGLTKSQVYQVYQFAEQIQQEIREASFYDRDLKRTEEWLSKNYN